MINPELVKGKEKEVIKYKHNELNITFTFYGDVNMELSAQSIINISEDPELQKYL